MFSRPAPKAKFSIKLKRFLAAHWRGLLILILPLISLPLVLPLPGEKHGWCGYCLLIMAVFWVTECIALPVTSFLPIVIFPFSGVMSTRLTCEAYVNDTIIMFVGSLILAYAVEQSGLHKRLALCAIKCIGYSHYKLLFAMCLVTMFVSMWITNTAATTMMVPINFALLKVFEDQGLLKIYDTNSDGEQIASDITTCYFCAATFSATIGGIGTLVGTGTNLVFRGLFIKEYPEAPEYLSFPLFSAFSIPYMIVMEFLVYLFLIIKYFGFMRPKSKAAKTSKLTKEGIKAAKQAVDEKWKALGKMTLWEIEVALLFIFAMALFFCRSPQMFNGWADLIIAHFNEQNARFIRDSAVAMGVGFLMLLLPANLKIFKNFTVKYYDELPKNQVHSVLDWPLMNSVMPYSFTFLLGGGFALSTAAKKEYSDLNGIIGQALSNLNTLPNLAVIFIIIVFTVFITNFASNVAMCNVVAPIAMKLAEQIGQNPLWYNIAAGFSASYCFCMPVGTPGNLIVQSAAKIPTKKMIIAGSVPTLTTILITWLAMAIWAPVIWPDLHKLPDWVKKQD